MSIKVGFVSSVIGTDIIIQMYDDSNKVTYRYNGELYHGVAIRECLAIKTGIYSIICKVEGEYLDEKDYEISGNREKIYTRKVLVKPIGYMDDDKFFEGNKYLPMIRDNAFLMTDKELSLLYNSNCVEGFSIGKTLKDEIPYNINYNILFNKHIGIFGNTGSGKSNTLTKLYTELFDNYLPHMTNKSEFVLFDFNGEYTGKQFISESNSEKKKVIKLNTRKKEDTIFVAEDSFWNEDILGLLFKATYNTQRPFLKYLVQNRKNYSEDSSSLLNYYKATVSNFLSTTNPRKEAKDLFISIIGIIKDTYDIEQIKKIHAEYEKFLWHNNSNCYYYGNTYLNNKSDIERVKQILVDIDELEKIDFVDELLIRSYLQLINSLLNSYVQFEHISPLISRINALRENLKNVLTVSNSLEKTSCVLEVISFRKCNQDIKKILPLIIAKSYYDSHKEYSDTGDVTKTLHFIIDEAHNILSSQSSREEESWKDYRLDLFEEIIKEGRKFGVFMTICSQRPADISHTIMSQFHNFFIHRLVNDKDLAIIDTAISSLDKISKNSIPSLPTGACIITGTSFVIPLTIQVDKIENKELRPDSDNVDLKDLWGINM